MRKKEGYKLDGNTKHTSYRVQTKKGYFTNFVASTGEGGTHYV
ncbi:hypothetical protein NXU95_22175 [Phocaeicola vulgatus]|nr:hypothetical protein [Phocaeicola vulgatus]